MAIDWGEFRKQVYSIGAPIFGPDGTAVAAIGVSVPSANCNRSQVKRIAKAVTAAAGEISDAIAHT